MVMMKKRKLIKLLMVITISSNWLVSVLECTCLSWSAHVWFVVHMSVLECTCLVCSARVCFGVYCVCFIVHMSGLECIVSVLEARVWVQLSRSSELLLKDLLSDPYCQLSVYKVCSQSQRSVLKQPFGRKMFHKI